MKIQTNLKRSWNRYLYLNWSRGIRHFSHCTMQTFFNWILCGGIISNSWRCYAMGTLSALSVLSEHYTDVIMGAMASQITSLTIVYSAVYSDADHIKHQSPASLAIVRRNVLAEHPRDMFGWTSMENAWLNIQEKCLAEHLWEMFGWTSMGNIGWTSLENVWLSIHGKYWAEHSWQLFGWTSIRNVLDEYSWHIFGWTSNGNVWLNIHEKWFAGHPWKTFGWASMGNDWLNIHEKCLAEHPWEMLGWIYMVNVWLSMHGKCWPKHTWEIFGWASMEKWLHIFVRHLMFQFQFHLVKPRDFLIIS